MLSIGKLRNPEYYLDQVASGAEDYYLGSGEAPGRWRGAGAIRMGLAGEVDAAVLRQVLAGVDPGDAVRLVRAGTPRRPRLPGLDLTFSAPKSVSVLYGLAAAEVSGEVVEAHEAAVSAALGYLEQHACFTRRRIDGVVEQVAGEGLVVAGFRHRTSRTGDPSLHTHCLVANLVQAVDGGWGALDARVVFVHSRTAGFVYQAVLRGELSARLGVSWRPVRNGHADIDGIDPQVLRGFSRRRQEIEAVLAERGLSSGPAAQAATLDTRRRKDHPVDPASLRDHWSERAAELGFDPATLADLLDTATGQVDADAIIRTLDGLGSPEGLTRRRSSFDRQDVLRALCEALPAGMDVSVADLEDLVDVFLADGDVVRIVNAGHLDTTVERDDGTEVAVSEDRRRWSTPEMLAVEADLIGNAMDRKNTGVAVASGSSIDKALLARPSLSWEQTDMVDAVCTSGDGVEVVVGAAGTGKTFALDAARDAWQRDGTPVIGCALAARAARELQNGSGIESTTIAGLLGHLDDPQRPGLTPGTVLVVDEAAMVDSRTLARLLGHARNDRAKVLLVGDHHQLPEIDAGGAFAGLAIRLGATELRENRRQNSPWERHALDQLRTGDVNDALGAYQRHGRITFADTAPDALAVMVGDWWRATQFGEQALMIATRNVDVDDLNAAARTRLEAAGDITGPDLDIDGRPFAAGDRVLFTRNDRHLGVINGDTGTVTSIDTDNQAVTVDVGRDEPVDVGPAQLAGRRVVHGYATTVHKAQGATVDRLLVYGDDRLYREAGYVAMSRGRDHNQLYVVTSRDTDLDAHPAAIETLDAADHLGNALSRSSAKTLATDEADQDRRHWGRSLESLWHQHDQLDAFLTATAPPATNSKAAARIAREHAELAAEAADLAKQREAADERLTATRRWRRNDRSTAVNLRRYIARLEETGTQLAERLAATERDLLTIEGEKQARRDWEAQHQYKFEDRHDLATAIARRQQIAARAAELAPSAEIVDQIGTPPRQPVDRPAWRAAAGALISYQARWDTTNPEGHVGGVEQSHRQRVDLAITEANRSRLDHGIHAETSLVPLDGTPQVLDLAHNGPAL